MLMANYDEEQEKGESGLNRAGEEAKHYAGDKAKEKLSGKGAKEAGKGTAKQAAKEGGKKAAKEGAKKASMAAGPEAYAAVEAADQAQQAVRDPKKAVKKTGIAIGAVIVIVAAPIIAAVLIVVVVAVTFLALIFGEIDVGEAISQDPPTSICSTIATTLSDANVGSISNNIDIYKSAASAADIPWEMLAAIHYVETGNDANAPNMYQFDPPPPGVDVNDFAEASNYAATFLQNKAKNGPVGIALEVNMDPADPADEKSIKDASWGYNGRADYMRDIAGDLGFDPDTQGYEGSAYVMNRWDVQRISMIVKIFDADGNVIDEINYEIDGTWKLFILLRNATYDDQGKIIQLNEACFPESTEVPIGCPVSHGIVGGYLYNPPAHRGIDMTNQAALDGNRVRSTHSGKVVFVSTVEHSQAGYWVTVENDTYKTRYLHLEPDIPVSLGQEVNRGDVVGIEDDTGLSSGRHLHYEVWKDGVVVDPTLFIPMENRLFAECKAIL